MRSLFGEDFNRVLMFSKVEYGLDQDSENEGLLNLKKKLSKGHAVYSDHLILIEVYQLWKFAVEKNDFCKQNYLNATRMSEIESLKYR
jgi:hypothetical protein